MNPNTSLCQDSIPCSEEIHAKERNIIEWLDRNGIYMSEPSKFPKKKHDSHLELKSELFLRRKKQIKH